MFLAGQNQIGNLLLDVGEDRSRHGGDTTERATISLIPKFPNHENEEGGHGLAPKAIRGHTEVHQSLTEGKVLQQLRSKPS